jgi:hypothetical protein
MTHLHKIELSVLLLTSALAIVGCGQIGYYTYQITHPDDKIGLGRRAQANPSNPMTEDTVTVSLFDFPDATYQLYVTKNTPSGYPLDWSRKNYPPMTHVGETTIRGGQGSFSFVLHSAIGLDQSGSTFSIDNRQPLFMVIDDLTGKQTHHLDMILRPDQIPQKTQYGR